MGETSIFARVFFGRACEDSRAMAYVVVRSPVAQIVVSWLRAIVCAYGGHFLVALRFEYSLLCRRLPMNVSQHVFRGVVSILVRGRPYYVAARFRRFANDETRVRFYVVFPRDTFRRARTEFRRRDRVLVSMSTEVVVVFRVFGDGVGAFRSVFCRFHAKRA